VSDLELNLTVVTGHLHELAAQQQTAADKITGANRATADIAAKVEQSHGLICWPATQAVSAGETARKNAGETMYKVSTEFNEKLITAANNYNNVDYREGRSLGEACKM
jgi:deoxyribodipyrimidine photolyase